VKCGIIFKKEKMISHKTEYYPDGFTEDGKPNGPKVITLYFGVNRVARYKRMTPEEKATALETIEHFEEILSIFKNRFKPEPVTDNIQKDPTRQ
jgi:hypothetical protein